MNTTTHRRCATVVAALLTALVTLPFLLAAPASATTSAAADGNSGWLRVGHLSPGTGAADVRLTPFSGGSNVTLRDVAYGEVSPFQRLTAGLYTVAVVPAGSDMSVNPMISKSIRIEPGSASTLIASGPRDNLQASVLPDDLTPPADGMARVRLIAATSGDQSVTAQVVDGPSLADAVAPGTATGYASVAAQTWSVQVDVTGTAGADSTISLRSGGVYSLLVLDDAAGGIRLSAVQDSQGAGTMPTGGVDTGAGGLPARSGTSSVAPTAVLVVGVVGMLLGALAAGLVLARTRRVAPW